MTIHAKLLSYNETRGREEVSKGNRWSSPPASMTSRLASVIFKMTLGVNYFKREQRPTLSDNSNLDISNYIFDRVWNFFSLQKLNISSAHLKSHGESWSLQGKLKRPLTKCGLHQAF